MFGVKIVAHVTAGCCIVRLNLHVRWGIGIASSIGPAPATSPPPAYAHNRLVTYLTDDGMITILQWRFSEYWAALGSPCGARAATIRSIPSATLAYRLRISSLSLRR